MLNYKNAPLSFLILFFVTKLSQSATEYAIYNKSMDQEHFLKLQEVMDKIMGVNEIEKGMMFTKSQNQEKEVQDLKNRTTDQRVSVIDKNKEETGDGNRLKKESEKEQEAKDNGLVNLIMEIENSGIYGEEKEFILQQVYKAPSVVHVFNYQLQTGKEIFFIPKTKDEESEECKQAYMTMKDPNKETVYCKAFISLILSTWVCSTIQKFDVTCQIMGINANVLDSKNTVNISAATILRTVINQNDFFGPSGISRQRLVHFNVNLKDENLTDSSHHKNLIQTVDEYSKKKTDAVIVVTGVMPALRHKEDKKKA